MPRQHSCTNIADTPLGEPNVQVRVQIMCIAPVAQGRENDSGDCEWTAQFEQLSGVNSVCDVEGRWVQLLDP